jgi:hypothetical protein
MTRTLRFQFAVLMSITFLAGTAFGLYLASQLIGNFIPELAK